MFWKKHELSLNRVYDKVTIREGGEKLTLHVNADPTRLVVGLSQAQKGLASITAETTEEDKEQIARFFSGVIFGEEQTESLFNYYFGDGSCVIAVCGKYFADRLSKLITKAQKKP